MVPAPWVLTCPEGDGSPHHLLPHPPPLVKNFCLLSQDNLLLLDLLAAYVAPAAISTLLRRSQGTLPLKQSSIWMPSSILSSHLYGFTGPWVFPSPARLSWTLRVQNKGYSCLFTCFCVLPEFWGLDLAPAQNISGIPGGSM